MEEKIFKYDIDGLANDMGVDLEMISNLYSEYLFEMKGNIQTVRSQCKLKYWTGLERILHNMKGISSSLNIDDLYMASADLERDLKFLKFQDVDLKIEKIAKLFNEAEINIREFFKKKGITI